MAQDAKAGVDRDWSGLGCANPGCAQPWPTPVRFCPYCGTAAAVPAVEPPAAPPEPEPEPAAVATAAPPLEREPRPVELSPIIAPPPGPQPTGAPHAPVAEREAIVRAAAPAPSWDELPVRGPAAKAPAPVGQQPPPQVQRQPQPQPQPKQTRKRPAWGWIIAILLGAATVSWWQSREGGDGASAPAAGATVRTYVTRETRIRISPTADGNNPVASLDRGDRLTGVWTTGADGTTPWLRITEGRHSGRYAWGANLAADPPPPLTRSIDADLTTLSSATLRASPAADAAPLTEVAAGVTLRVAGELATGWYEIRRPAGGVGYLPPGSLSEGAGLQIDVVPGPT